VRAPRLQRAGPLSSVSLCRPRPPASSCWQPRCAASGTPGSPGSRACCGDLGHAAGHSNAITSRLGRQPRVAGGGKPVRQPRQRARPPRACSAKKQWRCRATGKQQPRGAPALRSRGISAPFASRWLRRPGLRAMTSSWPVSALAPQEGHLSPAERPADGGRAPVNELAGAGAQARAHSRPARPQSSASHRLCLHQRFPSCRLVRAGPCGVPQFPAGCGPAPATLRERKPAAQRSPPTQPPRPPLPPLRGHLGLTATGHSWAHL
jgi:hypothetical protein